MKHEQKSLTYLLQQSYPHGSVCGGKHLDDNRDDLLLVLFCRQELPHLADRQRDMRSGKYIIVLNTFVLRY